MRNVIVCWVDNPNLFEGHVPLLFLGRRNRAMGFSNNVDILFLEGYELLSQEYKGRLREVGFSLHNLARLYRDVSIGYKVLDRFGDYEKKCFLRWLVVRQYLSGERVIHYDGDVVFNESPDILQKNFDGKNFVLQGCPALTCISDPAWFFEYRKQLDRFAVDIEGYSRDAWVKRAGWERTRRKKWAGVRYRHIISSDQDLISHLIHTGQIVQDAPAAVLKDMGDYIFFENPLYVHGHDFLGTDLPLHYAREEGIDYLNGRRVAIWHMQSEFSYYLYKFIQRKRFLSPLLSSRLKNGLEERDWEHYFNSVITKILNCRESLRLLVYRYFFQDNDFREVLTDKVWWSRGVFS